MLKKCSEYISGGFMILFGAVVLMASQNIKRMAGVSVGSDFFPKIAAAILITLGVITIITFLKNKNRHSDGDEASKAAETSEANEPADMDYVNVETDWKAPLISVVLLAVYIGLLEKVGFLIMTVFYLFSQITVLAPKEKRKYLLFGIISVVVTLIVYFLFVRVLSVMLPAGMLG